MLPPPILKRFQSTLPARGATDECPNVSKPFVLISIHAPRTGSDLSFCDFSPAQAHFNPRSPHGERRATGMHPFSAMRISIHAPRTGSDLQQTMLYLLRLISIHAPRTGSDFLPPPSSPARAIFQSTLPARGATALRRTAHRRSSRFQSTLPARGATSSKSLIAACTTFQSTLPARGATRRTHKPEGFQIKISIHAPRTGSDG